MAKIVLPPGSITVLCKAGMSEKERKRLFRILNTYALGYEIEVSGRPVFKFEERK